jgi:hypothetical protein
MLTGVPTKKKQQQHVNKKFNLRTEVTGDFNIHGTKYF